MNQHGKAKAPQPNRQTLEERERAERLKETLQVAAQPHRKGYDGDMADPLGIFLRANSHVRECYEAGCEYNSLVRKWRRAKGIPDSVRLAEMKGGGGIDEKPVEEWGLKIRACDEAMKCSGLPGFRAAQALILDGVFPRDSIAGPVKRAIHGLAIKLGKFQL